MSFRLDLPQYFAADDKTREIYAYLTRMVNKINYAFGFLNVPEQTAGAEMRVEDPNNKAIAISAKSTNTQYPSARAVYDYAVPQTRTVAGKTLDTDVVLAAADVGAVPEDREINGHPLSADVRLTPADLGAVDYVTAEGSDGAWTWRKWSGGVIEMWAAGVEISLSAWGAYSGDLYRATGDVSYPMELANADATVLVNAARSSTPVGVLIGYVRKYKNMARIYVVRPNQNETKFYADIYVRGLAAEEEDT